MTDDEVRPYQLTEAIRRRAAVLTAASQDFYVRAGRHIDPRALALDHVSRRDKVIEWTVKAAQAVGREVGQVGDVDVILQRLHRFSNKGDLALDTVLSCEELLRGDAGGDVEGVIGELVPVLKMRARLAAQEKLILSGPAGEDDDVLAEIQRDLARVSEIGKADTANSRELLPMDWQSIEIPETEDAYLVDGLIYREGVHMVAGQPFGCKSRMMAIVVGGVSTGANVLDRRVRATGRTLWVTGEHRAAELPSRLRAVANGLGVDPSMILCDVIGRGVSLSDAAHRQKIEKVANEYALIVIDSLRSTSAAKENDNDEMAAHLSWCSKLADGRPVVIVHHSSKAGDDVRGAGDIRAKLDALILAKKRNRVGDYSLKVETRDSAVDQIEIQIDHGEDGSMTAAVRDTRVAPAWEHDNDTATQHDQLRLDVIAAVQSGATSKTKIRFAVTGARARIDRAIDDLVHEGKIGKNEQGQFRVLVTLAGGGLLGPPASPARGHSAVPQTPLADPGEPWLSPARGAGAPGLAASQKKPGHPPGSDAVRDCPRLRLADDATSGVDDPFESAGGWCA